MIGLSNKGGKPILSSYDTSEGAKMQGMRIKRKHEAKEVLYFIILAEYPMCTTTTAAVAAVTATTETATQTRTAVLTVFLPCILCCASLPMRENPEEVPTYLVHCTTCETSTSSCFLRPAPTIPLPSSCLSHFASFTLREIINATLSLFTDTLLRF